MIALSTCLLNEWKNSFIFFPFADFTVWALKNWCFRIVVLNSWVPWTARRSNLSVLKEINSEYSLEGLMLKLKLQYFGYLMWRVNSLEKIFMLRNIEGRGWVGWMALPTQWTWVWENSWRWWRTGKPCVLQSMGSQRVRHSLTTEQQQLSGYDVDRVWHSSMSFWKHVRAISASGEIKTWKLFHDISYNWRNRTVDFQPVLPQTMKSIKPQLSDYICAPCKTMSSSKVETEAHLSCISSAHPSPMPSEGSVNLD